MKKEKYLVEVEVDVTIEGGPSLEDRLYAVERSLTGSLTRIGDIKASNVLAEPKHARIKKPTSVEIARLVKYIFETAYRVDDLTVQVHVSYNAIHNSQEIDIHLTGVETHLMQGYSRLIRATYIQHGNIKLSAIIANSVEALLRDAIREKVRRAARESEHLRRGEDTRMTNSAVLLGGCKNCVAKRWLNLGESCADRCGPSPLFERNIQLEQRGLLYPVQSLHPCALKHGGRERITNIRHWRVPTIVVP
jgi:hypothetical protein